MKFNNIIIEKANNGKLFAEEVASSFNIQELKEQIKNEYRKKLGSLVDIKN